MSQNKEQTFRISKLLSVIQNNSVCGFHGNLKRVTDNSGSFLLPGYSTFKNASGMN